MILDLLAFYSKAHTSGSRCPFWQEGVHTEQISNDEMVRPTVDDIHNNPVVRGYVDHPEHWRYSSARNCIDEQGLLDVC